MACAVVATACVDADDRAAKTTTLTAHDAIDIYLAKASRSARDSSTSVLSKRYNITMKAVRDVWNLRTWAWATMPYWMRSDLAKFLRKHLCTQCQRKGVTSLASACKDCAKPRRRGRPCLRSVFCASLRSDTADPSLATRTNAHGQQSMQTSQQTRPSPWHDRATIAYPVTHHSVPTVQVSHEDDVDNWLRQADLHTNVGMQAWDGWTPPVTTSVASKALSIKDHAFAPAAGTAEVAGWTPVTNTHMHTYVHMKGTSSVTVQRLRIPAWNELSAHGFSESESIDLSNDQVFSAIDLYMDQMFSQVITSSYPLPISSSSSEASMPVLHADCISDNGGLWRYEDPFASDVMPMM